MSTIPLARRWANACSSVPISGFLADAMLSLPDFGAGTGFTVEVYPFVGWGAELAGDGFAIFTDFDSGEIVIFLVADT